MAQPSPGSYNLRGTNNQLLSVSLFYEPWSNQTEALRSKDSFPVFTLGTDKEGYISVRKTFLEEKDPTGVKWAQKYLEGVHHLNRLLQSDWFSEAWEQYQNELEQILQMEALEKIKTISGSGSPAAFQAAKYLANKDWKKSGRGRGRPSKSEVNAEVKREAEKLTREHEDLERIRLVK